MGKLLQRLADPARSGVFRASDERAIREATHGAKLDVVAIEAKEKLFDSLSRALDFPQWFGRNWDALEDVLDDLSWRKGGEGYVLVFQSYPDGEELGILLDVLRSSAEYWAGRGKPFFAVFIDPAKRLELPNLYREP